MCDGVFSGASTVRRGAALPLDTPAATHHAPRTHTGKPHQEAEARVHLERDVKLGLRERKRVHGGLVDRLERQLEVAERGLRGRGGWW